MVAAPAAEARGCSRRGRLLSTPVKRVLYLVVLSRCYFHDTLSIVQVDEESNPAPVGGKVDAGTNYCRAGVTCFQALLAPQETLLPYVVMCLARCVPLSRG